MSRRHSLNYVYFGALFVLLALLHVFHVNLVEQGTSLNRLFYMVYAVGECLFEVAALILIGAWASEKFPAFAKGIFVTFTFVLFLMHLIDFPLMRIMDMSIWYSFSIVFAESFENFLELLKASNIQMVTWLLMGAGITVMVVVGIFLFRISDRLSSKKPFYFSYKAASLFVFSVLCILTLFDHQTSHIASATKDAPFLKALPWKTTLLTNSYPKWNLHTPLPPKPTQAWYQDKLKSLDVQPLHKPNIYLFIAESIREDFITDEVAPTLSQFRNEGISFPQAISGANATPLSWFSIFHGIYPFSWKDRQLKNWKVGSLPLQLLKKAGYQIHVLSASRLNYYQMDQILFGKDKMLADDFQVFADDDHANHVFDTKCIDHLIQKMNSAEEGHLFIVFLEGTHFDYSWPEHLSLPSRPFSKAIDYLRLTYSKDGLEGIKNRYRHAIYHIDEQFNRFLTALKSHPRQDEAVVVFTSDHGEEFFEEGRIFHASNLNRAQTRIPLYYRLPHQKTTSTLTSHLDIFPTLLDHVFGNVQPWFDGESILRERQKPFAISTRFNASRAPYEFMVTTEDELLVSRFEIRADIRQSKNLEIVSRKNLQGKMLETSSSQVYEKYQEILHSLFSQY
ncbi:MAG: sulfatase-like hydrolase/transferase [Rhabdochlamydiaceae bacterium]|nr:sulfatase-like hydrolase/transferase [Rhabdochlamydiaceae bacterium]